MDAASNLSPTERYSTLEFARNVLRQEAAAIEQLAEHLGEDFLHAVRLLDQCEGDVVVTGMGKAGLVGQKISATFCSTGTRSIFLHPSEAIHGDLAAYGQRIRCWRCP